jgi:hypothetical protein
MRYPFADHARTAIPCLQLRVMSCGQRLTGLSLQRYRLAVRSRFRSWLIHALRGGPVQSAARRPEGWYWLHGDWDWEWQAFFLELAGG